MTAALWAMAAGLTMLVAGALATIHYERDPWAPPDARRSRLANTAFTVAMVGGVVVLVSIWMPS